jgi:WD40 repeat protein
MKCGVCMQRTNGEVTLVAFSPDGKQIVSGSNDTSVRARTLGCVDRRQVEGVETLKGHTDLVTSVAFSPDGKRLSFVLASRYKMAHPIYRPS